MKNTLVKEGEKLRLKDWPTGPDEAHAAKKDEIKEKTEKLYEKLSLLQELLNAEHKQRLLVVIQGLDTAGKDSTTRRVFGPMGPAGVRVISYKAPTQPELEHDYLWRIHSQVPGNGEAVVFNRSHYEEVLVVRVQGLRPEAVWKKRFDHIAEFERMLSDEGTTILKFFLHISKAEQKVRLEARLADKQKHWKFEDTDLRDRQDWDEYWLAYEEALSRTSTAHAPWHVIPADKKWYRDYLVAEVLVSTLEGLNMQYPRSKPGMGKLKVV